MFNNFFFFENRVIYIMEKCGRARDATDGNITRRMRVACLITKARNTLSEYVTHCFFTTKAVTRTSLIIVLYVHCLSCLSQ
jgi:hypothetical protein